MGHLDPILISAMSEESIRQSIDRLSKKPRYVGDAVRTIHDVASVVAHKYGGSAEKMWLGRTAKEVHRSFTQIFGVGPGIASMILVLLHKHDLADLPDLDNIDVKPDVHVQRVMFRLGLSTSRSEGAAIEAARRYHPAYPGFLDPPLWRIGREWCFGERPNCAACPIGDVCPKVEVK